MVGGWELCVGGNEGHQTDRVCLLGGAGGLWRDSYQTLEPTDGSLDRGMEIGINMGMASGIGIGIIY